jgi:hypothetical protein
MIMTRKRSEDQTPSKAPLLLRFTLETIRRIEVAAKAAGMSKSVYAELALKDRFKKDRIE